MTDCGSQRSGATPPKGVVPLKDAPSGQPLEVVAISNHELAQELARTGLQEGVELVKSARDIPLATLRVRGPKGDAVLSGKMASIIMVHLDDGRKAPLLELEPGEQGHVEGLTATTPITKAFATLGLRENDRITLVRRLPPMDYIALMDGRRRLKISEDVAAKIWGRMGGRELQFSMTKSGEPFEILELFGGPPRQAQMRAMGLAQGKRLVLEGVEQAQTVSLGEQHPVAVTTVDGLRVLLHPQAARETLVRVK